MKFTSEQLRAKGFVPSGVPGKMVRLAVPAAPIQAPPRPSRLNSIERRWLGILVDRYPKSRINPQFRVRVSAFESATVTHYTADAAVFTAHSGCPTFWQCILWEVKDRRRKPHSDELVRAKLARVMNPWIASVWQATWDGNSWVERQLA